MKVVLQDHYQSMAVRLAPGVHEVNVSLGQYLIDNGYATREVEDLPPAQDPVALNEEQGLEETVVEDTPAADQSAELVLEVGTVEDNPEPAQDPVSPKSKKK